MKTSVWFDKWCNLGPLSQIVTRRDLYDARFDANATISEMVSDNQWIWSNVWSIRFPEISCLPVPNLSNTSDRAIWRDTNGNEKSFSVKQVWEDYKESETKVN